ncbi:DMT family transporter [Limimaricola cinnabarinus]|uniref:Permease of the drug/metabolite transporter (DMT) superfamily n=1 Tax=Limimaricola cinnabarinus LL-001 TaxID=1337093 RepID=U3A8J3_9RHOB|nr:DMT family transporter [Limimaricola cinnabarinus]GAD53984.1 permease of the drug/metabolite transporter (DMT) superfamily [Limimaricola cinnabarinus LL-001]
MTAQPTPANWLSILLLGLIWGGTFAVVRLALDGYGPVTVACARTALGAVAMLGLMQLMRRRVPPLTRALAGYLVAIGLLSTALPFLLLSWGQQYVPSAFAGISMAALPLFVLPLAALFSDEPFHWRSAIGVGVGFLGALVLIGPGVLAPGAGLSAWGQMACLAAALSYAVASILTRRCPPIDGIVLTALSLTVGAMVLVPAMLLTEGVPGWTGAVPGAALVFLGLLPTALAALIRVTVIRSAGSVFMTLVNYQVPVWSMAIGALGLGEALPWRFFIALALILTGLGISQGRNLRGLLAHGAPARQGGAR